MHTKVGVAVALILAASMASAHESESELASRTWSINMTPCRAWPLYWTGDGVCLLNGKGVAFERPLKHLSGADVAYLRSKKVSLPRKNAFDLRAATNDVSAAIDRYADLLQAAQENRVEGTVVTDGSLVAPVPRQRRDGKHTEENRRPPGGAENIRPEVWGIHQQTTIAVNVKEVKRLSEILRDLEDKKKALLYLGRTHPMLLQDENSRTSAAKLK